MKILIVNSADQWGGGETHVYDLAIGLKAKGIEVTVACRPNSALRLRLQSVNIPCIVLPLLNSVDFYSIYRLSRFVRQEKINIIHAHLSRDYWQCIMTVALQPDVKVVLTRHVLFPLKQTIFHKRLLQRVSQIICVSQGTKDVLMSNNTIMANQLTVIPNGIKIHHVSNLESIKESLRINKDSIAIGIFGTIEENKGQQDFIEMARLVRNKHPEAKFYIVGSEEKAEYVTHIKRLVKQYDLSKDIIFTGYRNDAVSIMKAMDIVVSFAKLDAFGLVIIEAMSQGRPVIAYQTEGAAEIFKDSEAGTLVQIGDYHKAADEVAALLGDSEKRKKMGLAGVELVHQKYDIQLMVEKTIKIYKRILE